MFNRIGAVRSPRCRPRRVAFTALAGVVALLGSFIGVASSGASTTQVKPDLSFYAGKTVTYIVPQSPGGSYSQSIIPALPFAQSYLHTTFNLVYVPQGSSLVGDDEIYAAPADGLTIGQEGIAALLASVYSLGTTGVNFPIQKLSFIAGNHANPETIVSCEGSPIRSIMQAIKSKSPFKVINTGSGSGYELIKVVFGMYHSPMVSLSGFPNTAATTAACLGGDAPLALQTVASLTVSDFQQGLVHPLVVTGPVAKTSAFYRYFKNVPTLATLWSKLDPPKTPAGKAVAPVILNQYGPTAPGTWLSGPPGVAPAKLAALRAAFKYAWTRDSVKQAQLVANIGIGWLDPTTAVSTIKKLLLRKTLVGRFINS